MEEEDHSGSRRQETCCVMRNAWLMLTCIEGRLAVIVHGPNGCGADFSLPARRSGETGYYCATDLSEMDVIMGGEEALAGKIGSVYERTRPDLIFVLGTCVSEIIGDDARGVCSQAAARLGIPVIFLPTSGMVEKGSGDAKIDVVQALVEHVMKPGRRIDRSVNFIAHPWPSYRNIRDELSRHLSALDIRLHAVLAGTPTLAEIERAPRAALNVIVSDDPARRVGLRMREKFGTPYLLAPRPLGIAATSRMFQLIAEAFDGRPGRAALVEGWKRGETRRLAKEHPGLNGKTLAVVARRPDRDLLELFAELGLAVTVHGPERSEARRWDGSDLAYLEDSPASALKSHRPMRHMRPPASFLMYSGMHELAGELEAELGSLFFQTYGRYCR